MQSIVLSLLPWMASTAPADEAAVTVSVFYLGSLVAFEQPALRLGDECFIPVSQAAKLGWTVSRSGESVAVKIGDRTIRTFIRKIAGSHFIPLRATADTAGAVSEWSAPNVIAVFARVERIAVDEDRIEVRCTMPVVRRVLVLDGPPRVVVDVLGARIVTSKPPSVTGKLRYSQFTPGTVRVVAQVDKVPKVDQGPLAGRTITAQWTGAATVDPTPLPPAIPPQPLILRALEMDQVSPDEIVIRVPFDGQAAGKFSVNRDAQGVYWVDFPSGKVSASNGDSRRAPNEIVRSASLVVKPSGGCALRVELAEPMGIKVGAEGGEVAVRIVRPSRSGSISDKRIVIDAGHGGKDDGASWGVGPQALVEKVLALSIAKLVSEILIEAGAMVVMTRSDDTFIELTDRASVATASSADIFVSIHINSNTIPDTRSGTFTYYRADDPDSRFLAECIQTAVVSATGLPDNGVRSDSTVYSTGFAVLRRTTVPAVLLEVAYINHSVDRELLRTEDFRRKVAEGIMKGIEKYLSNQRFAASGLKDERR